MLRDYGITGLRDYTLTDSEKTALNSFRPGSPEAAEITWQEYKIGDLFEITSSKRKFNAVDVKFGGLYPYVARGESNNGIRGYITEDKSHLNPGHTISFGQDTATLFYQARPYFTGDKIKIFHPKSFVSLNRQTALFCITAMNKSFAAFSWGSSSYNVSVLNKTRIELPVKTKSGKTEIAFDFMEEFISAMQKIVIKNVVDYLDLRIRKTAEITGLQPSS